MPRGGVINVGERRKTRSQKEKPSVIQNKYDIVPEKLTTITDECDVKNGSEKLEEEKSSVKREETDIVLQTINTVTNECDVKDSSEKIEEQPPVKRALVLVLQKLDVVADKYEESNADSNFNSSEEADDEDDNEKEEQEKSHRKSVNLSKIRVATHDSEKCSIKPGSRTMKISFKGSGKSEAEKKEARERNSRIHLSPTHILGGLTVQDLVVGTGDTVRNFREVSVYYETRLQSNNKVVKKRIRGPPLKFTLGYCEINKGWDLGILGMKVGGKRQIVCPPHFGYGRREPEIPLDETLIFDIEVKSVR